jgi:hypothetical protein
VDTSAKQPILSKLGLLRRVSGLEMRYLLLKMKECHLLFKQRALLKYTLSNGLQNQKFFLKT